jgi:hypothetical protein
MPYGTERSFAKVRIFGTFPRFQLKVSARVAGSAPRGSQFRAKAQLTAVLSPAHHSQQHAKNFSGECFRDPHLIVPFMHQDRRNSFTRVESTDMRRIRLVSGEGIRERTAVSRIVRPIITPLR